MALPPAPTERAERRPALSPVDGAAMSTPASRGAESPLAPPLSVGGQTVHFGTAEDMSAIATDAVDLVVTSPPYWEMKDYDHPDQIGRDESYDRYLSRLNDVWRECGRVCTETGILAINVGKCRRGGRLRHMAIDIASRIDDDRWRLIDDIVWYVPNALPQPSHYTDRLLDDKYENVLVFASPDVDADDRTFNPIRVAQKYRDDEPRADKLNDDGRSLGNVWKVRAYRPPTIRDRAYHIAAFPEELVHPLVHAFSDPGDLVADPFCGSGTTLKVARHMDREGVGYELDTDLRELITARIREHFSPPDWATLDVLSGESPERRRNTRGTTLDEFGESVTHE